MCIEATELGRPFIADFDETKLRHYLAHAADFYELSARGVRKEIASPLDVAKNIQARNPASRGFPVLEAVVEAHTLRPDGTVLAEPGYEAATRLYLVPSPGLENIEIPVQPCSDHIEVALDVIRDDAVGVDHGMALHVADCGFDVYGFKAGGAALDGEQFLNAKAEAYFRLREIYKSAYISHRTSAEIDDDCEAQLCAVEYRELPRGQIQVEPKEDARRRGVQSPDRAEAEVMAFCQIVPKHQTIIYNQQYVISPIYPGCTFIGHAQTWWGNIDLHHPQEQIWPKPKWPVTPGGITDRLLGDHPNVFGDLSASSGLKALTRGSDHARSFLSRHQDKLLFGTDCLHHGLGGGQCWGGRILDALRELEPSEEILRKILWTNHASFFGYRHPCDYAPVKAEDSIQKRLQAGFANARVRLRKVRLAAADKGHLGSHDGHELHVGIKG